MLSNELLITSPCVGISGPINLLEPNEQELKLTNRLESTFEGMNILLSKSEICKRREALFDLQTCCNEWVFEKCIMNMHSNIAAKSMTAKLFTFGSYRLGVDLIDADIDTLLVCPNFITREEFFDEFYEFLSHNRNVKSLQCAKDAFVPIITMKFCDVEMDLLFAQIDEKSVSDDFNLQENTEKLMRTMDEKDIRSINGVRVTDDILNLVYNKKTFRLALKIIKLWATRCGIYSNAMGFLGGVSWAILVARICQLWPKGTVYKIVLNFFYIYGNKWKWPTPILLRNIKKYSSLSLTQWNPEINENEKFHEMPIITPCYPCQNSAYNVTCSHKTIIIEHMKQAHELCQQISKSTRNFSDLFQPCFFFKYQHYLMVTFKGKIKTEFEKDKSLVESRLRILAQYLEKNPHISLVHLNVKKVEGTEIDSLDATDIFFCRWFIGFRKEKMNTNLYIDKEIEKFEKLVKVKVDISYVKRSDISPYLSDKDKKILNDTTSTLSRKRRNSDTNSDKNTKKQKV